MTVEEVGIAWKGVGPAIRLEVIATYHVLVYVPRMLQRKIGTHHFFIAGFT